MDMGQSAAVVGCGCPGRETSAAVVARGVSLTDRVRGALLHIQTAIVNIWNMYVRESCIPDRAGLCC